MSRQGVEDRWQSAKEVGTAVKFLVARTRSWKGVLEARLDRRKVDAVMSNVISGLYVYAVVLAASIV